LSDTVRPGAQRIVAPGTAISRIAEVEDFEHLIPEMDCSDPNDRHVLAAAIAGEVDILVTDNSGDFPPGTSGLHALA